MKVLLIGHTYVVEANRRKLAAIASTGEVELTAVVPERWPHALGSHESGPIEDGLNYRLIVTRIRGHGDHRRIFYEDLPGTILRERPDLVHLEQEPWSLAALQVAWPKLRRPGSFKFSLFTWDNIMGRQPPLHWACQRLALRTADGIIAGNADAAECVRSHGFSRHVFVVPQLGIQVTSRAAKSSPRQRPVTVGYIGRFVQAKGIHTLIDAAASLTCPVKLQLLGAGEDEVRLRALVETLGLQERVEFVPPVSHREVPAYLAGMDVLVLPSLTTPTWKEQFGHVLVEAMACGVPVIGSTSGAIPEVIADAGLVFREGDAEDLADKLTMLLEHEELRHAMAGRGRLRVAGHYTHERIAQQTVAAWKAVLGDGC